MMQASLEPSCLFSAFPAGRFINGYPSISVAAADVATRFDGWSVLGCRFGRSKELWRDGNATYHLTKPMPL